jgi:putative transposase
LIETLNGSLRDECLNIYWLDTLAEAQRLIEAWRVDYNESRPYMALGNKTPAEYLLQAIPSPVAQGENAAEN